MILSDEDLLHEIAEKREGSKYTNKANDAGGPTRWGVTQETLSGWRGRAVDPADVAALTLEEALQIYRAQYLHGPGFSKVGDAQLRALLVDCAILHGPGNAAKFLQRALHVKDDGELGPISFAALRLANPRRVWLDTYAERIAFIGRLITDNLTDNDHDGIPDATENSKGWHNRFADILREYVI